jgi:CheY-like chemotaxis protein/CHASE3 domain sensor protein
MQSATKNFRLLLVLGGLLALLIFNSFVLYFNFIKMGDHQALVTHTSEVIDEIHATFEDVVNAESSARGYLLTNSQDHLDLLTESRQDFANHSSKLIQLVSDNPEQSQRAHNLQDIAQKRIEILSSLVSLNSRPVASQIKTLLGQGKTAMDDLRGLSILMETSERKLLELRTRETANAREVFLWFLVITTIFSLIAITFAFFQFQKNQNQIATEAREKNHQAWVREHISEAAKIFSGTSALVDVIKELQHFLSLKFGTPASKFFTLKFNSLQLVSAYGTTEATTNNEWDSRKGNGLLEEALRRTAPWVVEKVPDDYWKIGSSLGSAKPRSIMFVPLLFQGNTIGMIEMATFTHMSEEHIELMSQLGETIGIGLNAAQSREHLQELLQQTQQQTEELQAQQEELRTNNEELEQQARALEAQQHAMNLKNRELEAAQNQLENKAADLQRSSQYKSEFLAKMSHELRTPLNGLMILSTLLTENKEKNLTEQQKQFAQSIHSAGTDLLTLINDILDLSKIEARKLSLRCENFSLSAFTDHLYRTFEPQMSSRHLDFEIHISEEAKKKTLATDRQRLEQILRNFLSNGLKFTESGTISIFVELMPNERVQFIVRDTGIGIPKDKLDLIFEAFEQADGSVSRRFGGTGLGLTISRELSLLLGGEISLRSVEGKGSDFILTIPTVLKIDENINTPKEGRASGGDKLDFSANQKTFPPRNNELLSSSLKADIRAALEGVDLAKRTILIVEDDEKFRSSVVEVAKSYGFETVEVGRGDVAIALLQEYTPSAILLDIKLPEISGLGVLEMIKQLPNLRHVPVHMISAMDFQHNAMRMGALGYLTKPVTMEKIRSAMDRIESIISEKVRKVLLIEDDKVQSMAILHLISGADVQVVSVRTGNEAIAQLKQNNFDCIVLDLTLPDVSGFDLLSELNSLEMSLPPVVIYTGKDLSTQEEDYLRRYSESIIIKGVRSPERLLDEVNLFLHRVESLLPLEQRELLTNLRSQEKTFDGNTVLIADDDMRNVFALTSALESKGLKVIIAKNGLEAVENIENNSEIDLVLMDIMMPKMDGFEAIRKIRADGRFKDLPIIALTAKAMKEDHEKCMEAGANDYLTKPVNLINLVTVLKVWLAHEEF